MKIIVKSSKPTYPTHNSTKKTILQSSTTRTTQSARVITRPITPRTTLKTHPVGIGYELLALAPSVKGDIGKVRKKIVELIDSGCTNFNAALSISRNIKLGDKIKYLLAAIIILKKHAELDLCKLLENSASEPTILSLNKENIRRLHELKNNSSADD